MGRVSGGGVALKGVPARLLRWPAAAEAVRPCWFGGGPWQARRVVNPGGR